MAGVKGKCKGARGPCGKTIYDEETVHGYCSSCLDSMPPAIRWYQTLDSGKREEFGTGAVRDVQDDKPRYDLLPPSALKRVAQLYARGAKKYNDRNWEKGIPVSRCYASALRHLYQFGEGNVDEDHLAAVVFNVLAIIHFQEQGRIDMLDFPEKREPVRQSRADLNSDYS